MFCKRYIKIYLSWIVRNLWTMSSVKSKKTQAVHLFWRLKILRDCFLKFWPLFLLQLPVHVFMLCVFDPVGLFPSLDWRHLFLLQYQYLCSACLILYILFKVTSNYAVCVWSCIIVPFRFDLSFFLQLPVIMLCVFDPVYYVYSYQ